MVRPTQDFNEIPSDDRSVIEFRTVKASPTLRMKLQPYDEKIVGTSLACRGSEPW
jgi:hypothetical protein